MKKLFGLLFFGVAWLGAQGPAFGPWWDSPVVRDLNLRPDQHKQIAATVRSYRDQLIQQRADVQKAEGALEDLMSEEQVNEGKVTAAIDRVVEARGAMMKTVSVMSLRLRMVLTPDQWRELRKRRPEGPGMSRRGFPRERGMGMGRRPGPPPNPPEGPRPPEPPRRDE